jgi:hypothetical protein
VQGQQLAGEIAFHTWSSVSTDLIVSNLVPFTSIPMSHGRHDRSISLAPGRCAHRVIVCC